MNMKVFNLQKFIALALALAVLLLFPVSSVGAVDGENYARTVFAAYDDQPIANVPIKAYRVAVMTRSGFSMTEPFSSYPISEIPADVEAWNELAQTLQGYCDASAVTPDISGKTNPAGEFQITGDMGLYLVAATGIQADGYLTSSPFFVYLDESEEELPAKLKFSLDADSEHEYRKVLKIWDDAGLESQRPEQVVVNLYCDGKKYTTVTLNAACNWRHTWELPTGHVWSLSEDVPAGYIPKVELQAITFTVTNKPTSPAPAPTPTPTPGRLPQTGLCWWPIPLLAVFGLAFLILAVLRRRSQTYEE